LGGGLRYIFNHCCEIAIILFKFITVCCTRMAHGLNEPMRIAVHLMFFQIMPLKNT